MNNYKTNFSVVSIKLVGTYGLKFETAFYIIQLSSVVKAFWLIISLY
jgi:hypothetical protein